MTMTPGVFKNRYMKKNKVFRELETEPFEVLTDDVAVEMDEVLYTDELKKALTLALATLTAREERVIRERFFYGKTLEEVGQTFSLTRDRIRQIQNKAIRKLHPPTRKDMLQDFMEAI